MYNLIPSKVCPKCQAEKPREEYHKNASRIDGISYHCKACCADHQAEYLRRPEARALARDRYHRYVSTPDGAARYGWYRLCCRVRHKDRKQLRCYRGVEVRMTRAEFMAWAVPAYTAWMEAHPGQSPSLDRVDETGHYEVGNLQLLTIPENTAKTRKAVNHAAPPGTKFCGRCREYKPFADFRKAPDGSKATFGLFGWCAACSRAREQERSKKRRRRKSA